MGYIHIQLRNQDSLFDQTYIDLLNKLQTVLIIYI